MMYTRGGIYLGEIGSVTYTPAAERQHYALLCAKADAAMVRALKLTPPAGELVQPERKHGA